MTTLAPYLGYWFWPNPGNAHYSDHKVIALLVLSALLILGSFALRYLRSQMTNSVTKKLSASWAGACLTFGIISLVLVVSRVEDIQFIAMRFLWALWLLAIIVYVGFQLMSFKRRHYTIVEKKHVADARDRYLPKKKKR